MKLPFFKFKLICEKYASHWTEWSLLETEDWHTATPCSLETRFKWWHQVSSRATILAICERNQFFCFRIWIDWLLKHLLPPFSYYLKDTSATSLSKLCHNQMFCELWFSQFLLPIDNSTAISRVVIRRFCHMSLSTAENMEWLISMCAFRELGSPL